MKDRNFKRHMAYEALVILGLLALLLFITRLWPILLLVILGIFIAVLRLLFLSSKKVDPVMPLLALPEPQPQKEPSEKDLQELAYRLIQQRITQILLGRFQDARWVWENARAKEDILAGNKVYVVLNRAGGYRRGLVVIRNLHVYDVVFDMKAEQPSKETIPIIKTAEPAIPIESEEPVVEGEEDIPEDYGLLAFQWVDAHVIDLNDRINEAIGERKSSILIPADELPVGESWIEICKELERNDFTGAICREDGILIEFEQ